MTEAEVEVYDLDLDEEVLSHLAILESFYYIKGELDRELIEDEFVQEVYDWQVKHFRDYGKPATPSVITEQFDLDLQPPLTAIEDLIDRLKERWFKGNVRAYMGEISDAYKEDPMKVVEVLPKVAREIGSIIAPRGEEFGTGDYERAIHRYDERILRPRGPGFGFDLVDNHFYELRGLTFFIAPPKTYKSWMGCNTTISNVEDGKCVGLATLELPSEETDMRIRCLSADVPYWRYLRGSLSQEDRAKLKEASEILDGMGTYKAFKPEPGKRDIRSLVEKAHDLGADLLVIDQLQYVEGDNGLPLGSGKPQDFWNPLNIARDLSDHLPIVIIHQFNRSVMHADKMPEMQQAKGSSSIEETATLALGLWANKDMRRSNLVELGTLASRNYQYESWEVGVELSRGCNFKMLGRVDHDE